MERAARRIANETVCSTAGAPSRYPSVVIILIIMLPVLPAQGIQDLRISQALAEQDC